MKNPIDKIKEEILNLELSKSSDIVIYNGTIRRPYDNTFIETCGDNRQHPQVLLVLVTPGGDAHAAYRIGRGLQNYYDKVSVFVPGWCKSAGTLLCTAAHAIYMGDLGELGPIDVQRAIKDELGESSSGLTEDAAIEALENAALKIFKNFVLELNDFTEGQVTFKTAADTAEKMAGSLLGPIASQIDPIKIGENSRAVSIANDYGLRLNHESRNLKDKSISTLVSSYSSHGFVIDRKEAEQLFETVEEPTEDMKAISSILGKMAHFPLGEENDPPITIFIDKGETDESKENTESSDNGKTIATGTNDGGHPENADRTETLSADTA